MYCLLQSIAHQTAVLEARSALAPSTVSKSPHDFWQEQERHPIYNGRPFERSGPAIGIYEPIFAQVKDNISKIGNTRVSEEVAVQTKNLFVESSRIFETEMAREEAVYPILGKLLGIKLKPHYRLARNEGESGTCKSTESGAVTLVKLADQSTEAITAHFELKNEPGNGGDSELQGPLTLRKYIASGQVGTEVIFSAAIGLANGMIVYSILAYAMYHAAPASLFPLRVRNSLSLALSSSTSLWYNVLLKRSNLTGTHSKRTKLSMSRNFSNYSKPQFSS